MIKNQVNVSIDDATVNAVIAKFKDLGTALINVVISAIF